MDKVFRKASIDKQKLEDANYAFEQVDSFDGVRIYRIIKDRFGTYTIGSQCGEEFVDRFATNVNGVVVFNWREEMNA